MQIEKIVGGLHKTPIFTSICVAIGALSALTMLDADHRNIYSIAIKVLFAASFLVGLRSARGQAQPGKEYGRGWWPSLLLTLELACLGAGGYVLLVET